MSWVSSLFNQNSVVRHTVTLPATQAGATSIWANIGPIPPMVAVKQIGIYADNNIANLTCDVISDAAAYNLATASTGNRIKHVQATKSGSMAGNALVLDFSATPVAIDESNQAFLAIRLAASTITTGTVFTLRIDYTPMQSNVLSVGRPMDRSFKVLKYVDATSTMENITDLMTNNANPYLISPVSAAESTLAWSSTDDYIYVGSVNALSRLVFIPKSGSAVEMTGEYWDGSAWTAFTMQDNTSDRQAAPSTLTYPGEIVIPTLSDWAAKKLDDDPATIREARITAGTEMGPVFFSNPPLKWARFVPTTVNSAVRLVRLYPSV